MLGRVARLTMSAALAGAVSILGTAPGWAGSEHLLHAALGPETSVPYGWLDFCHRYRGECAADAAGPHDIDLTAKAYKDIQRVNAHVNHAIEPVSDMDHWGVVDRWDYPTDGKGDCEDYALMKRRLLVELGYPRAALLMTVVKEKNGDGHAILTVKTSRGEFVLDNMNDAVRPWTNTPYRFVKRQSQLDQNVWVVIDDPNAPLFAAR